MSKIQYGQQTLRTHHCSPDDLPYVLRAIDDFMRLFDYPAAPLNDEIADELPTVDPPRGSVRFQLTSTFNGMTKVASAKIVDEQGVALDPLEEIELYDGVGRYVADAIGTEYGRASQRQQLDGTLRWEPDSLGGLGSTIASDNYTVKADAGDVSPDFLDGKIANPDTYSAVTHQLVAFDVIDAGAGNHQVRLFTDKASGVDNYTVQVNADDTTPQFLHASFTDPAAVAYNSAIHSLVHFSVVASGSERTIRAFTSKDEETGRVRTQAVDNLGYLHTKWQDTAAYDANRDDLSYFALVGNNERCFVRDPRTSNGVGDKAEFLADQFVDLTATPFDSAEHVAVKVVKETVAGDTDLKLYLPRADVQTAVGTVRVRISGTVPARDADGPGIGAGNLITLDINDHYVEGASVTLLNDSWSPVVAPSEVDMFELVWQAYPEPDGRYTLYAPTQLQSTIGFDQSNPYGQSLLHDQGGQPKFRDDDLC